MKIIVDVPNYDGNGLDIVWESNAEYSIDVKNDNVLILANKNGLISLAKQMLYMAYNDLPLGSHVHYDSFFTKMVDNKFDLIIEKQDQSVDGSKPLKK